MNPAELASAAANSQTPSAASQPVARLYGEPMLEYPKDLYIPPDALEVFLERFEGPLDLLLWLIRSQIRCNGYTYGAAYRAVYGLC